MTDETTTAFRLARGRPLPLGTAWYSEGVNFSLLCRHGTAVRLVVSHADRDERLAAIDLDPRANRTGDHWHVFVAGLPESFRYGWQVDGPSGGGHRYDPSVLLLDPASVMISDGAVWGDPSVHTSPGPLHPPPTFQTTVAPGESGPILTAPALAPVPRHRRQSLFVRGPAYHWQEDAPPLTPLEDSVVYELHVRGFTCHPSSGVAHPGTFAGLAEKIPYLKWLGVTAVELLPVHEFDELDCPFSDPDTGRRHRNFWGYNSLGFAAVKASYAASGPRHGQIAEFRDMVQAFHQAGIEVILDVVFNHTGEGDHRGTTWSFRGLDNELYYMLGPRGEYLNFTGCGNTFNCNHPVVRNLLLDCLRYWVGVMHVDGFRFDLASIFGRDRRGNVLAEPPVVEMIAEDGVLAATKLIAEPWDAAGLYQVGGFPFGRRWSEWNGKYRDDVRRFWRGDPGTVGALATRLCGSSDLYQWSGRRPRHSINFITCHDGFTLNDLVSYDRKHNRANGEDNRDGCNDNWSWNCGHEGPTDDADVIGLRRRQARNHMATLMLSQGVPMLLGGDEFLRTQHGNNNAWCQDNDISWVDWDLCNRNADFLRFTRQMIRLRARHPVLRRRNFLRGDPQRPDIAWHGTQPNRPDFGHSSRVIAFTLDGRQTRREPDQDFYVAMNGGRDARSFRVPPSPSGKPWRRVVDTALASPLDIVEEESHGPRIADGDSLPVAPFSLVVLISEPA